MEENNQPNNNFEQNAQEQQHVNPISNVQTNNFNVSSSQDATTKKGNGKTGLLVIVMILIAAIVAGLIYYFAFYTKPDQIYKRLVTSTMDSYTKQLKDADYTTSKTAIKLDANIETENDDIENDILDLINKTDIALEVQTNNEDKQIVLNLESNYDKESLLNLQMYSNIEDEQTYVYLKELLNKYIEVEMDEDEFYSSLSELLDSQKMSNEEKIALQKAMKILKEEITAMVKPEYCSTQKEDINVNGKTINATKNTLKLTAKQIKEEFTTLANNLKNNEEFLNCFEEKEEIEESLEDLLESVEDIEEDEESTIECNIYTQGLMNKLVKFSMVSSYGEEDEEKVTVAFTKIEENKYYVEALSSDDEVFTGTVNLEQMTETEGTLKVEFDAKELGKIQVNLGYSQTYNDDIDKVDIKNSVKSDELTSDDQKELTTNLQKSKLYKLIETFTGTSLTEDATKNNITTNNTNIEIKDDDENEEEKDENVKTSDNQIITYDDKYKITFNVPQGYESRYVSENYRSLEKDDISVKMSSSYSNKDKYYESLQKTVKTYQEEDTYDSVELSEMKSIKINGRTFYYATFSYVYSSENYENKYSTKYIWSEVSDKYVVDIQVRGEKDMTSEELKQILTITVEENK